MDSSHQDSLRRSPHFDSIGARSNASAPVVAYMANRLVMNWW
jgi:hypothetical protein